MTRNHGIVVTLIGFGLLFTSIIFSSGSHPNRDFMGNLSRMEIVFVEGTYHPRKRGSFGYPDTPAYHEGRVAIPLKYPLSASILILLVGIGIAITCKSKNNSKS